MRNDNWIWLLEWYYKHCDGDWEHGNGIKIGTLDNPGWFIKLSLMDTEFENKEFKVINIERSKNDWIHCSVKNNIFEGFGGPFNLPEIIEIFRNWIEN